MRMLPEPVERSHPVPMLPAASMEPEPVLAWSAPVAPSMWMEPEPVRVWTSPELASERWSEPEPELRLPRRRCPRSVPLRSRCAR